MLIQRIIAEIEKIAPLQFQAPWDKSGLQVASSIIEAKCVGVFLDPTPQNIATAIAKKCDFLLSHHPLCLKPVLPNRLNNWHESLKLLLCNNLPLYASHTSLDVNPQGPASWLGQKLGMENFEVLDAVGFNEKKYAMGYGGIGNLPMPMTVEDFCAKIMNWMNLEQISVCGPGAKNPIKRVAWCGGSGSEFIDAAFIRGADVFVTGDVKYHAALDAQLTVFDVGHHGYEEQMMKEFSEMLKSLLVDLDVIFIPSASPFTVFFA